MARAFSLTWLFLWVAGFCFFPPSVMAQEAIKVANHVEDSKAKDSQAAQKRPFFSDHARGWHWYERLKGLNPRELVPKELVQKDTQPVTSDSSTSDLIQVDPSVMVEKYRKMIVRAQDRALMDPSPENLYRYMALQQDAMVRSHRFATNWQRILLQRPELDDTVKFPTTQGARHVAYAREKKETVAAITALKDSHGLYFFFSESCPYCHSFSPIVKAFAEKYGWTVFAIRMEPVTSNPTGVGYREAGLTVLREFPKAARDNGFAARLGVTSVPALFAANPSAGQIMPIAHSMISETEIESRILFLTQGGKSPLGEHP